MIKRIVVLQFLVAAGLAAGAISLSNRSLIGIEFFVQSDWRPPSLSEVSVEFFIVNEGPLPVTLREASITSFFGGNMLGTQKIDSVIRVPARSQVTVEANIEEDWYEVPLLEPSMLGSYLLEAEASSLLRSERIGIHFTMESGDIYGTEIGKGNFSESEASDLLLDKYYRNIVSGGPPKDGIPPIEEPRYISVAEAEEFLEDWDVVFLVEAGDGAWIYPQKVLVWHEVVNEVIDGERVSVTYCPLTGSAVGYRGLIGGSETTFGTSGMLLNSNLVMYDRETGSYWPQVLGTAIRGPRKGETLETFPVVWTRWALAREGHPDALVLSTDTGYLRAYGSDPYGSYLKNGTYYDSGGRLFGVMNSDDRLPDKEVVVGVNGRDANLAILKATIVKQKVANLMIEGKPIAAIYDESLDAVRVFSRKVGSDVLEFAFENGKIRDATSGSEWSARGEALGGPLLGVRLQVIDSFDVMWFAWAAFYPETELYG